LLSSAAPFEEGPGIRTTVFLKGCDMELLVPQPGAAPAVPINGYWKIWSGLAGIALRQLRRGQEKSVASGKIKTRQEFSAGFYHAKENRFVFGGQLRDAPS